MSLYTIKQEAHEVIEKYLTSFDSETGEIFDEATYLSTQKQLAELENKANESMEWMLQYRQNIAWEIASIESEINRLSDMKNILSKKGDWIGRYIEYFFRTMWQGKTLTFGLFQLGFRKSSAVKIIDENAIPREFLRVIPESTAPDKTAIKDALKDWKQIAGAEIEERETFFIK